MHFCFIVEARYRSEHMPMVITQQLMQWGHEVDLLEPQTTIMCLSDLTKVHYDAYVLKTVSDGPGLSILEAAEVAGIPTINHSQAIRQVRDKAVAISRARAYDIPVPHTFFVTHPELLVQIPYDNYPLVVKPTNGSSCRGIYKISNPDDLATIHITEAGECFFLAQQYVENNGFDIKLYVTGKRVFAVAKRSPLHPEVEVSKCLIPVSNQLRELALRVGDTFGLDIYGLDVIDTAFGPIVVDINDFPSFGLVPDAVELVASHIIEIAARNVVHRVNPTQTTLLSNHHEEFVVSA